MTEQHQEFLDAGAEVIALVRDTLEAAQTYLREHDIPFPCMVDPEHKVYDLYEVKSKLMSLGQRPALFVIDRDGIVRYACLGWQQWEIPSNDEVLEVCRSIHCGAGAAA